jgi:hypothetical protein
MTSINYLYLGILIKTIKVMKLELTDEQVTALDAAIKTRTRLIENLLNTWKTSTITESTEYLINVYSKELESINEINSKIK